MNVRIRWYLFFMVLAFVKVNAQGLPVLTTTSLSTFDNNYGHNGNYAKDFNNLRGPYVGTWQFEGDGITLVIKLTKMDKVINKREFNGEVTFYDYTDQLELRYRLVKKGTLLFDNLNAGVVDANTSYGIATALYDLSGRLLDRTRNVVGSFTAKRLMINGPQKMLFNLYLGNYTLKNLPTYYQDGQPLFSIPTGEIEMVKID